MVYTQEESRNKWDTLFAPFGEGFPSHGSLDSQAVQVKSKTHLERAIHSNLCEGPVGTSGIDLLAKKTGLGEQQEAWELPSAEKKLLLLFGVI